MEKLQQHIEALIFASDQPITLPEIRECLEAIFETPFEDADLEQALEGLMTRYQEELYALEIVPIANGYQFLSKGAYHHTVGTFLKQTTKKRLSRAALETLSIIAYKQPVSKGELELIRGVSCDYSIQKLLEKELVSIEGRSDGPGRPLLYGTSAKFMDYFGLRDLRDLPKPKDFKIPDNQIGEQAPIEEESEPQIQEEE
ncbi:MAG: SMC-Scp complex subunit ScpB [Saprospiraceae bacterium]|nr:SMC-Scp complex subunit ScpB [Saprospiraceae bacterium]